MAKFYVQSGKVQCVTSAPDDDFERAALWLVHQAMVNVLPVYEKAGLSVEEKSDAAIVQASLVLEDTIQLSELGFDREDAFHLDTFEILMQWHQLMVAVSRFEDLL